jgi:hypothetical protein
MNLNSERERQNGREEEEEEEEDDDGEQRSVDYGKNQSDDGGGNESWSGSKGAYCTKQRWLSFARLNRRRLEGIRWIGAVAFA